jgi:hypothetical protein
MIIRVTASGQAYVELIVFELQRADEWIGVVPVTTRRTVMIYHQNVGIRLVKQHVGDIIPKAPVPMMDLAVFVVHCSQPSPVECLTQK